MGMALLGSAVAAWAQPQPAPQPAPQQIKLAMKPTGAAAAAFGAAPRIPGAGAMAGNGAAMASIMAAASKAPLAAGAEESAEATLKFEVPTVLSRFTLNAELLMVYWLTSLLARSGLAFANSVEPALLEVPGHGV
mgnify:CR=1 FL=1